MEQIEKALRLQKELDKLRPIEKEQEAIIMQKFRLDWNYHSNHLEGNSLTFGETKALILFGITAQGKPLKDHFEITGHDEAIKWIIEVIKGDYPLTEKFIREFHTLLLKEPYEVNAITPDGQPTRKRIAVGQYKTVANHVLTNTGEIFRFATPEETPALMNDLLNWYREKSSAPDINPIILAAEFHYRFIRIHPFDDGNGRTARILMNFILMKFNYPPVIIRTEDKAAYFSVLQQADGGLVGPFIDYVAKNLNRSLEIMIAGATGKNLEEPDDLDKEIALLEQKIKGVGTKIEISRTKEAILNIYDNSTSKLWQQFILACQRFDKFYVKTECFLDMSSTTTVRQIDALDIIRNYIDEYTANIFLDYNFINFNQKGFGEFNYRSEIKFQFNLAGGYIVTLPNNTKTIEKSYDEQLTDDEINEIVKIETRRHKELIEKKLIEVQNKKS